MSLLNISLYFFFKFCHNNWNAFVSGSRSRERNRDRDRERDHDRDRERDRDRDKDRGDRRKSSNNKTSSSPTKKTDKKQRDEEREFEALREKYKLKEFPDSWKRLKKVEKLDLKSPDFVKLKRAFQKPTRYVWIISGTRNPDFGFMEVSRRDDDGVKAFLHFCQIFGIFED